MIELFVWLLLGHVFADFVWQSDSLVARKGQAGRRLGALAEHGVILLACHLVAAAFYLSLDVALVVLGIVAVHLVLDWLKALADTRVDRPLTLFLLDQLLHVVTLAAAAAWSSATPVRIDPELFSGLSVAAVYVSAWVVVWRGGGFFMAMLLSVCRLPADDVEDGPELGRLIGVLERLLVVTLVLEEAWAGIGLLVAAKSVARFKELDDRRFSEYYLVGTLGSLLLAIGVGLAAFELLARL